MELITRADLEQFKKELFEVLKQGGSKPAPENQKWLKSYQVKNLLKISPGTLRNVRINGTLQFTKKGGIFYYKYDFKKAVAAIRIIATVKSRYKG